MRAASYDFRSFRVLTPLHGGPDAMGVPRHDLSSNGNPCGAWPTALQALQHADARHYPDPAYTALRGQLGAWHGVATDRIVLAASASEFIQRISLAVALTAGPEAAVWQPAHAYGDYARAAQAAGLPMTDAPQRASLLWACEPSSPLGQADAGLPQRVAALRSSQTLVLDQAYEPLRLDGAPSLDGAAQERVWRLLTPNKALGLTGVRAAYAIAPRVVAPALWARLHALAPSWPLGAHGVALLQAWATPGCGTWLQACRATLRGWKARQIEGLRALDWRVEPSIAHFFVASCADWAGDGGLLKLEAELAALRRHGIKLRDCASFGLPGRVRMAVAAPATQDALLATLRHGVPAVSALDCSPARRVVQ